MLVQQIVANSAPLRRLTQFAERVIPPDVKLIILPHHYGQPVSSTARDIIGDDFDCRIAQGYPTTLVVKYGVNL